MHLYKKNRSVADFGILISVVLFLGVVVYFFTALNNMSDGIDSQQKEALHKAIDNAVVSCYAVEGCYPDSIEYLEEHYGLTYDHKTFYVEYGSFGANVRPAINVIVLEAGGVKDE
ncbi:MAG: hypothetical protein IKK96_03910 [Lachnospiraceae bacterium]|nr:hypothetical protein [Lachnospiraceae bacterium]